MMQRKTVRLVWFGVIICTVAASSSLKAQNYYGDEMLIFKERISDEGPVSTPEPPPPRPTTPEPPPPPGN